MTFNHSKENSGFFKIQTHLEQKKLKGIHWQCSGLQLVSRQGVAALNLEGACPVVMRNYSDKSTLRGKGLILANIQGTVYHGSEVKGAEA